MTMTTDETLERLLGAGHLIKRIETKGGVAPIATVEALSRAEQAIHEAATLIRSLRDERDAAREALMPFAEFVPDFFDDGYQDGDIVKVESHHGGLDLTLTVADFRRARNIIGEA